MCVYVYGYGIYTYMQVAMCVHVYMLMCLPMCMSMFECGSFVCVCICVCMWWYVCINMCLSLQMCCAWHVCICVGVCLRWFCLARKIKQVLSIRMRWQEAPVYLVPGCLDVTEDTSAMPTSLPVSEEVLYCPVPPLFTKGSTEGPESGHQSSTPIPQGPREFHD